jgi:mutator protein MutT
MNEKITTLLLLQRGNEVLLAMKKRGFGAGRWNGVGGKLDPGETIEQAVVRECQEEIGVTPVIYEKVAEHEFLEFHDKQPHRMVVHTYLCNSWQGTPEESEEMAPKWFGISEVPYNDMWPDDEFWLPQVLAGKKVRTKFVLDEEDAIKSREVVEVESL